ncbi:hypothetical protein ACU4GD_39615 [Cupriavidus basilensis]
MCRTLDMGYHLDKDFAVLEAHGRASIRSVFVSQPLLRGRAFNLNAQLQYDDKRLRDEMDLFETSVARKRVGLWTAGVNGNVAGTTYSAAGRPCSRRATARDGFASTIRSPSSSTRSARRPAAASAR